jgi:methyl-accepting chemotaxis protein
MQDCFKDSFLLLKMIGTNMSFHQIPESQITDISSDSCTFDSSIITLFKAQPSQRRFLVLYGFEQKFLHFSKSFCFISKDIELIYNEKKILKEEKFNCKLICDRILDGIKEYFEIFNMTVTKGEDFPDYYELSNFPLLIAKMHSIESIDLNLSQIVGQDQIDYTPIFSSLVQLKQLRMICLNLQSLQKNNSFNIIKELLSSMEKFSSSLASFSAYFDVDWYQSSLISDEIIIQILNLLASNRIEKITELGFSLMNCDTITDNLIQNLRDIVPKFIKLETLYLDLRNTRTSTDQIEKMKDSIQRDGLQVDISVDEMDIFSTERFNQAVNARLEPDQNLEEMIKNIRTNSNEIRVETLRIWFGYETIESFVKDYSNLSLDELIEEFIKMNI